MFGLFKKLRTKGIDNSFTVFGNQCKPIKSISADIAVDDKKSPFAIYEGESCETLYTAAIKKGEYYFLIKNGFITELDSELLIAVNSLLLATSKQLIDIITGNGLSAGKEQILRRLYRLKEKGFLKQLHFKTDQSISAFKFYALGEHGCAFLESKDIHVNMRKYIEKADPVSVKKILAANQLITACAQENKISFSSAKTVLNPDISDCIVRPHTIVNQEESLYFVEAVRFDDGWKDALSDKLSRYRNVVKNKHQVNIPISEPPVIILQGESPDHVWEIFEMISSELKNELKIAYTYDKILLQDFSHAFFA